MKSDTEGFFQDAWPSGTCYGCGPANLEGIQLKSRWSEDGRFAVAQLQVNAKYNAGLPNTMYGGTVASLIDCHSVWTAIAETYRQEGREYGSAPLIRCVTGRLTVEYLKATPLDVPVYLKAWVEGPVGRKTRVLSELGAGNIVTAKGDVIAVRI